MTNLTSSSIQDIRTFAQSVQAQQNLLAWAEEERTKSAIPEVLWDTNVQILSGSDALEYLLENKLASFSGGNGYTKFGSHSSQYCTKRVADLLDRYANVSDGIWAARSDIPYAKTFNPRRNLANFDKVIKYETAPGEIAAPLLPIVDAQTAQEYGVEPDDFWNWICSTNQPIAITEGLKKALCLIAHGIPAIAIRGITQWHLKGGLELHPAIARFATSGRSIYIVFDQDTKPKTIANVHKQVRKLGSVLETRGCKVLVPMWNPDLGKGIDDCLYRQGETSQSWLCGLLRDPLTLRQYKRDAQIVAAFNTIKRYNSLSFPIERDTQGEYMPNLPPIKPGEIYTVTADMNSGKTVRIGLDWVQPALDCGYHVLVLSPLNSLGQQTAKDWSVAHIHEQGTKPKEQQQFWDAVRQRPAVVVCPDSIGKIPQWFWGKPMLLVLDEANQVTEHICQGNTLKLRYAPVLEMVVNAAQHAISSGGAIVLSEDSLPDRCVNWWKAVSGAVAVRCIQHRKLGIPWDVNIYKGNISGFRKNLLEALRLDKPLLFVTTSRREAKRLEHIASERGIERVTRIDSETNEGGAYRLFFQNPNQWLKLHQPQLLILSPSAKSGVSIEGGVAVEDAYFSSVWAYFPSLATDTHMQLLGRYRPSVPRQVFVAPFILGSRDEQQHSPKAVKHRLEQNLAVMKLVNIQNNERELSSVELAVIDYWAVSVVVSGSQKAIAKEALIHRLESAGHSVNQIDAGYDKAVSDAWKQAQETIWQNEALEIANACIEECHTPEWASVTLDSMESTRAARMLAHKVLWREEFPGVAFDDQDEVYHAITRDYGMMRRGVLLQAQAEHPEAVKESDRITAEAILSGKIRALHRLPKDYIKAAIINRLGVLRLLDSNPYSNQDKRCIAIKTQSLRYADEISYWLRLQIKPSQTPVEICNKLLRKLGLKAEPIARPGKRGEQNNRVYAIPDLQHPLRQRLLQAACHRLSDPVSTICSKTNPIQIMDTSLLSPRNVVKKSENFVGQLAKSDNSSSSGVIKSGFKGEINVDEPSHMMNLSGDQLRFMGQRCYQHA